MALCMCGCYGMQHEDSGQAAAHPPPQATAVPPPPPPPPTPAPGPNPAGSTSTFSSVGEGGSGTPPPKRRAPEKATNAEKDSDAPLEYYFVLAENTEEVDEGTYSMPTSTKMKRLHSLGYIEHVTVPRRSTPSDITDIIVNNFSTIPAIQSSGVDLKLWRLLCIHSVEKGVAARLVPSMRNKPVSIWDLEAAAATHRQAKSFRKCLYIALPKNSINLPLSSPAEDAATREDDQPAWERMEEDEEDLPQSPFNSTPKKEPSPKNPSADKAKTSELDDVPQVGPIDDALRLHVNMTRPSSNRHWWPIHPIEPYATAQKIVSTIQRQLHRIQNQSAGALNTEGILNLVEFDMIPEIAFILGFPEEFVAQTAPPKKFCIGPNGLEPIIHVLCHLRRFLFGAQLRSFDCSGSIYSALFSFRIGVERDEYDPSQFVLMRKIMRVNSAMFPEAEESERFTVLGLSVWSDKPERFAARLAVDFELDGEGRISNNNCLRLGRHGLDGFMYLVDDILDVLPIDHDSYVELFELVRGLCEQLGNRMSNYVKSYGKRKKTEAPPGSENGSAGSGGSEAKDERKAYGTRSASRTQQSDSESVYEFDPTPEEFRRPSPPPQPRPRPRPKPSHRGTAGYSSSDTNSSGGTSSDRLQKLANISSSFRLLRTAVEQFPHPDAARKKDWTTFKDIRDAHKCWRKVSLIFHPDCNRNVNNPAWRETCEAVTKILNNAFS
ncbi:hypothetical protein MVEN_00109700 [Mycena venus]|uniref:J domain-containing protein n=1 Tax=Mycena venus TaxID=2733690 RepID=A0A8H6Z4M5_9AGAR|nr:hypothetical protein MVEN_00109700 [Mycena venus]